MAKFVFKSPVSRKLRTRDRDKGQHTAVASHKAYLTSQSLRRRDILGMTWYQLNYVEDMGAGKGNPLATNDCKIHYRICSFMHVWQYPWEIDST